MSYLKRIELEEVLETDEDTPSGAYLKVVDVVEVVDQDGNQFIQESNPG